MYAHPQLLAQLASERRRDLAAGPAQPALPVPRRPHPVRAHVGWSLVSLGLRLALPPPRGH